MSTENTCLNHTFTCYENVLGAQIAMKNATLVAECNGTCDLMQVALDGNAGKNKVAWQSLDIGL